jgi:hypothetical protein
MKDIEIVEQAACCKRSIGMLCGDLIADDQ